MFWFRKFSVGFPILFQHANSLSVSNLYQRTFLHSRKNGSLNALNTLFRSVICSILYKYASRINYNVIWKVLTIEFFSSPATHCYVYVLITSKFQRFTVLRGYDYFSPMTMILRSSMYVFVRIKIRI